MNEKLYPSEEPKKLLTRLHALANLIFGCWHKFEIHDVMTQRDPRCVFCGKKLSECEVE